MSIEAMKQALEALGPNAPECCGCRVEWEIAITALRQAIEKAEKQEPVAWMWRCKPYCDWPNWSVSLKRPADSGRDGHQRTEGYEDIPLYTTPQPKRELNCVCGAVWDGEEMVHAPRKREWVGLTDEEIALVCAECAASAHNWNDISFARAIEAKLKEKNT